MHSVADWLPESASQFPLTLQVLHSDLPLPLVAVPSQLLTARAFGASAGAAHHPLGLLVHWLSTRTLSGSCPVCCTLVSGQMPIAQVAPVAPVVPVALLPTAAG